MKILFIHQNFPGQYKHIAPALAEVPGNEVIAIGERPNLGRLRHPKVREVGYKPPQGAGDKTHPYVRRLEAAVRRGQQAARVGFHLKDQGFTPDIICCHPGWGEGLFLRDVWPDTRILNFCEMHTRTKGYDINFNPNAQTSLDGLLKLRVRKSIYLLSMEQADWGIAPTHWQKSSFPDFLHDRISVIFDGVDTDQVCPDPTRTFTTKSGLTLGADDEVITFINRNLEPYRGYDVFMRALPDILAQRPNAQVLIVGDRGVSYGRPAPDGQSYADMFWDEVKGRLDTSRVHFLGRIPYGDLVDMMRISSVHVYLTYPFILSWSMVEAMSIGCLIVGSATPPVEEMLTDGENGLLFDFFDAQQLAARVDEALSHPDRFRSLREAARRTVIERYELQRICLPQQLQLIHDVAAGRSPRGGSDTEADFADVPTLGRVVG